MMITVICTEIINHCAGTRNQHSVLGQSYFKTNKFTEKDEICMVIREVGMEEEKLEEGSQKLQVKS